MNAQLFEFQSIFSLIDNRRFVHIVNNNNGENKWKEYGRSDLQITKECEIGFFSYEAGQKKTCLFCLSSLICIQFEGRAESHSSIVSNATDYFFHRVRANKSCIFQYNVFNIVTRLYPYTANDSQVYLLRGRKNQKILFPPPDVKTQIIKSRSMT